MLVSTRTALIPALLATALILPSTGCDEVLDASVCLPDDATKPATTEPTPDPVTAEDRAPWCHQGDIHLSSPIVWDDIELAAMSALYGTDVWPVPDISIAHATADMFCADEHSLGGLTSDGYTIISTTPGSGSYGDSGSDLGPLTLPASYSLADGLDFQCEMCGYYPLLEATADPDLPVSVDPGLGMTWLRKDIDPVTGVVTVGCDNGVQCDPIAGDTPCDTPLPLLCFLDLALPQPVSVVTPNLYFTWAGGIVATTPLIAPSLDGLATLADADTACADEFGLDWRVAEFHDGWGWNFVAYGNVGESDRFWVNIDDQPDGTCWAQ